MTPKSIKKLKNLWLLIMSGENWNKLGRMKSTAKGNIKSLTDRGLRKKPKGMNKRWIPKLWYQKFRNDNQLIGGGVK